jgi:hypothetical protein
MAATVLADNCSWSAIASLFFSFLFSVYFYFYFLKKKKKRSSLLGSRGPAPTPLQQLPALSQPGSL